MQITMEDMRRCNYCVEGVERFFEREKLDYLDFLKNGIDEDTFLATGSVFARKAVKLAKLAQQQKDLPR